MIVGEVGQSQVLCVRSNANAWGLRHADGFERHYIMLFKKVKGTGGRTPDGYRHKTLTSNETLYDSGALATSTCCCHGSKIG